MSKKLSEIVEEEFDRLNTNIADRDKEIARLNKEGREIERSRDEWKSRHDSIWRQGEAQQRRAEKAESEILRLNGVVDKFRHSNELYQKELRQTQGGRLTGPLIKEAWLQTKSIEFMMFEEMAKWLNTHPTPGPEADAFEKWAVEDHWLNVLQLEKGSDGKYTDPEARRIHKAFLAGQAQGGKEK